MASAALAGILKLAANDRESLRKCDVYRIIDAAHAAGKLDSFVYWLLAARPDLTAEVDDCVDEIEEASEFDDYFGS